MDLLCHMLRSAWRRVVDPHCPSFKIKRRARFDKLVWRNRISSDILARPNSRPMTIGSPPWARSSKRNCPNQNAKLAPTKHSVRSAVQNYAQNLPEFRNHVDDDSSLRTKRSRITTMESCAFDDVTGNSEHCTGRNAINPITHAENRRWTADCVRVDRIVQLQTENTLAALGDDRRYPTESLGRIDDSSFLLHVHLPR